MPLSQYRDVGSKTVAMRINTVYNECFLEGMSKIPDRSVDMICTDLPYGTTQSYWDIVIPFPPMWEQYSRVIKCNGAIILFGMEPFSSMLRMSNLKSFKYDIIWDKIKGTGYLNAKKQPMRNHETISVFYNKQCTYNPQKTKGHILKSAFKSKNLQSEVYGTTNSDSVYHSTERYPRSIQAFSTDTQKSSLHPNQKPVALVEWLIKTYSHEGDLVLDSCIGSGTTAIASLNTGRNYIGFEKDSPIYETCINRIAAHESLLRQV